MIPGVPYDEELEYIESTGTQWIDTGIKPKLTTKARMKVCNKAWTGDVIFGFTPPSTVSSWDTKDWRIFNHSNTVYFDMLGGARINGSTFTAGEWRELEIGNYYVKDIVTGSTLISGTTRTDSSAYESNTYTLTLNKAGYNGAMSQNKWAYVKIYDGDTIVQDLIPVRVGTTALMYDRVTGTFPAHYGTFVAGPVVARPVMGLHFYPWVYTARDYIQDGLVAMWDGIENAGWGTHDDSLLGIRNLITGNTVAFAAGSGLSYTRNALKYYTETGAAWSMALSSEYTGTADKTIETVWRVVAMPSAPSANVYIAQFGSGSYRLPTIVSSGAASIFVAGIGQPGLDVNVIGGTQIISTSMTSSSTDGTKCFKDGSSLRSYTSASTTTGTLVSLFYSGTTSWPAGTNLELHSVRIYNRALTAAEISHNNNIDKWRFNLP